MKSRPKQMFALMAGFSLVEVVLAIGIVSFCLISVIGLLPVGLGAIKNSREQAAASLCLSQVSDAIRNATTNSAGFYQALGVYTNITWQAQSASFSLTNISLGGTPTTNSEDQRLTVYICINPPKGTFTNGTALISVAWPNRATWISNNSVWTNAEGFVSSWLVYIPNE